MQPQSELFGMNIFRPLLSFTREQLEHYAQTENLTWIYDESNDDNRYDRNFLRNEILPKVHERWTHFDRTVQRSAQHCFEQQQLINELLQETFLEHCQTPTEFQLHNFNQYSSPKQTALLRMWFSLNQWEMPSKRQLKQLINDVVLAKKEANPQFHLGKQIVRRYQFCLYLTADFLDLTGACLEMQDCFQIILADFMCNEPLGTLFFLGNNIPLNYRPLIYRFKSASAIQEKLNTTRNAQGKRSRKYGKNWGFPLGNATAFHLFFMVTNYKVRSVFSRFLNIPKNSQNLPHFILFI